MTTRPPSPGEDTLGWADHDEIVSQLLAETDELRHQVATLTYDLGKARERIEELEYRWRRYTGVSHE